jgi:hypothetical protein
MFFAILCLIIVAFIGTGHTPDQYGWMMFIGLSWMAGYLDCRKFARSDQEKNRVMPLDLREAPEIPDDASLFES